jgi:hypothetical protein
MSEEEIKTNPVHYRIYGRPVRCGERFPAGWNWDSDLKYVTCPKCLELAQKKEEKK